MNEIELHKIDCPTCGEKMELKQLFISCPNNHILVSTGKENMNADKEKLRTYHFSDKLDVVIENVMEVHNRPDRVHEIKTKDKKKYYVMPNWYCIEIEY